MYNANKIELHNGNKLPNKTFIFVHVWVHVYMDDISHRFCPFLSAKYLCLCLSRLCSLLFFLRFFVRFCSMIHMEFVFFVYYFRFCSFDEKISIIFMLLISLGQSAHVYACCCWCCFCYSFSHYYIHTWSYRLAFK